VEKRDSEKAEAESLMKVVILKANELKSPVGNYCVVGNEKAQIPRELSARSFELKRGQTWVPQKH
jgi:hypothetical protein